MIKKRIVCSVAAAIALIVNSSIGNDVRVSEKGLAIIGNTEGCRLNPYVCPAGLITNGIGNTQFNPSATVTIEQVARDWAKNIEIAETCLLNTAPSELSQGQHDAFTSFIFNSGCHRFRYNRNKTETTIYKLIAAGRYSQACEQLPRWVYGGGKKLKGLVIRRAKERDLCLS
ncbi:lysozyme [Motilimonas cestriensis]|uniref:Lysozyme n=1 Tax=Motilimonas cestriensis TaxID=2742685 RepID=A0ABS8WDU2_9GAMM|nr:lysozyme [Motilimonas cestriensis]MCE2597217.1 lysozyme [Motilimonas cestriensis]